MKSMYMAIFNVWAALLALAFTAPGAVVVEAAKLVPWRDGAVAPYRFLDDLDPKAPMDGVGESEKESSDKPPIMGESYQFDWNTGKVSSVAGSWDAAQVIPAYRNPEPFPEVKGTWHHWDLEEAPSGKPEDRLFKLKPADATFPNGDVFYPRNRDEGRRDPESQFHSSLGGSGGIRQTVVVPPAERVPEDELPIQAPESKIRPGDVPVAGVEDDIEHRYGKYFDQVHDAVTMAHLNEEDTAACHIKGSSFDGGGEAEAASHIVRVANYRADGVELLKRTAGSEKKEGDNAKDTTTFRVRIPMQVFNEVKTPVDCSTGEQTEVVCTLFSPCYHGKNAGFEFAGCMPQTAVDHYDAFKNLAPQSKCPPFTTPCNWVSQEVEKGNLFNKEGKACK